LPAEVESAVRQHESFLAGETLADEVGYGAAGDNAYDSMIGDGFIVRVRVRRI
jgi:isoleucyl-tRNA synthetase